MRASQNRSPFPARTLAADHQLVGQSVYVTTEPGSEPMGELMAAFDELPRVRRGPLDSLYAALRRRAPQVSATRPGDGEDVLRVAYRAQEAQIAWDAGLDQYVWRTGDGGQLGSDVEKTAELVAWTLGASVNSGGTA